MKDLMDKSTEHRDTDSENFDRGIMESRNKTRLDDRSQSHVIFGHPLRAAVLVHRKSLLPSGRQPFMTAMPVDQSSVDDTETFRHAVDFLCRLAPHWTLSQCQDGTWYGPPPRLPYQAP